MPMFPNLFPLRGADVDKIIHGAFRILQTTGAVVENSEILQRLADFGAQIDQAGQRAFFSRAFMESFVSQSQPVYRSSGVSFSAFAGVYHGRYLDPDDGQYKPWTEERLLTYVKLARALSHVDHVSMLGCPIVEVRQELQPLYEKLYCWKYAIAGGSAIWDTSLCSPIYDMYAAYAGEKQCGIEQLFNGTVYLISPLKWGRAEAEQFLYFHGKGLRTNIGTMPVIGGTAPVTLAGALALQVAESLFIAIVNRCFFQTMTVHLSSSLPVMDMVTGSFRYGRPEQGLMTLAGAQVAEALGASFSAHGGLTDSVEPGSESGVQKAHSAMISAAASGRGVIEAGLLGVDEIFSPIQMILDNEATAAFAHVTKGIPVNDDTLALSLIEEVGPGGDFLSTQHTAEHVRASLWQPALWSRHMYSSWEAKGKKTELERARDIYRTKMSESPPLQSDISDCLEQSLRQIIERTAKGQ